MTAPTRHLGPFSWPPDPPARTLREHYAGVLIIADDRPLRRSYVLDPATGCPVIPLAADGPDALTDEETESLVFLIPDEADGSLQLLCSVADLDPRTHEAADRHLIYHGPSHERRWALLRVESAKIGPRIFDPQLFIAPNPLRSAEPALCKWANARKDALRTLATARIGAGADLSLMVGIDPLGIDVRTRFGPARIEFDEPAMDRAAAEARMQALLNEPGAAHTTGTPSP